MQSYLIISNDPTKREAVALSVAKAIGIDDFDITMIERGEGEEKKPKLSLGIEDVKNMQKKLFLKPFRGEKKAVILKEAHLLTSEAQNALLKVLEEPPVNTIIILTAESADTLLPTVRSRCTIRDLGHEGITITKAEQQEFAEILHEISDWGVGKSLKQAEGLAKNKDEALEWIEKMILMVREQMLQNLLFERAERVDNSYYMSLLKNLQKTHQAIKTTNVNLRLALESLFLSASAR